MERLLNVKEAAEILNVSEMTIRRWTNAGSLRCYRVGGKCERRFKVEDLHRFLGSGETTRGPEGASLGFGGLRVPDGSHLAHLSLDPGEALEVGASYVMEGLNSNETVLLVAPEVRTEAFAKALRGQGAEVDDLVRRGRLHLSQGMNDPAGMLTQIAGVAMKSVGAFRVFGDMTWTRSKGWTLEALRQLEEAAKAAPVSTGRLLLCQYSLDSFSGAAAMMAVETHGFTVYKGQLIESSYHRR
jgi:excisionase family DNA binding protein